jgi:drug/metabolite transporter (DMT)-like permease
MNIRFVFNKHSFRGGIFLAGTFIFFIAANKFTTAANAIVLQFTAPIFILILSAIFFRQKFRRGDVITVCMTSIGISLFFLDQLSTGYLLGNFMGITAGFFLANMLIVTGQADWDSRMSGILLGHLFTAAIGVPMIVFFPITLSLLPTLSILALGIFQLGIPYILYGLAAKHCSPLACALIGAVEPLLNPVWVFIFNGEAPGIFALIGGFIVIVTIVIWCIWSNATTKVQKEISIAN